MNEHVTQLAQETSGTYAPDARCEDRAAAIAEKAADAASDLYVAMERENRRTRFDLAMERAGAVR